MRREERRMESARTVSSETEKEISTKNIPEKEASEIAYQNKDIASKIFAEQLKGKSFNVYGVETGKIKAVLPTNIPAIKVNELRLDNLLELEDGTVALVDYESEYKKESKVKYLNYLTGIVNRYERKGRSCPDLRMIVVYTGDIRREQVSENYDVGAVTADPEQMELIILPLSYRRQKEKKEKISETVDLAVKLQDREQQLFVLAGILTFTDKIIDEEHAKTIRRAIQMTKVARIFEKEKEEAVKREREKMEQIAREERERIQQAAKEKRRKALMAEKRKIALKMLADGELSPEKIAQYAGINIKLSKNLPDSRAGIFPSNRKSKCPCHTLQKAQCHIY